MSLQRERTEDIFVSVLIEGGEIAFGQLEMRHVSAIS